MEMQVLAFYAFSAIAVGSSILLVSIGNMARALFLFFIVLFSVAGLYVFALADFVAITQILVYVGGVLVLMLFAFMLSSRELLNQLQNGTSQFLALPAWQALFIAVSFLAVLVYTAIHIGTAEPGWITAAKEADATIRPTDNTIQYIGAQLMTHYLLPFEVISVLLMMALIGAAHLTRKEGGT